MARSIKSKRGMALRRIKRVRYAKKELIRLNNMLGLPNKEEKAEEDIEMETEKVDDKKGLSSKDYNLLQRIVHERSDTDDSDVDKVFDEVMVLTSSKFLRRKCQAKQHDENKRQVAISNFKATEGATASDGTPEMKEQYQKRKRDATTLVDDFGSYPKWMNQKKIQAMAKVNRSMKLKRQKRLEHAKYRRPIKLKPVLDSDDDDDEEKEEDEEKDNASEVDSDEGLEMETEEVTTTATAESSKEKGKKEVEKKVKKIEEVEEVEEVEKVEKKKETATVASAKPSDTEVTIETIDLSD